MSEVRESAKIFKEVLTRHNYALVVVLIITFSATTALIAQLAMERTKRDIDSWIGANKATIQELLFVDNAYAIEYQLSRRPTTGINERITQILISDRGGTVLRLQNENSGLSNFQSLLKFLTVSETVDLTIAEQNIGRLKVSAVPDIKTVLIQVGLLAAALFTLFAIVRLITRFSLQQLSSTIIEPLVRLQVTMRNAVEGDKKANDSSSAWPNREILILSQTFKSVLAKNQKLIEQREKMAGLAAKVDLARQVAHDIRSPLTAFEVILHQLDGLDEDRKLLVRNAVNRIRDIANQLLSRNKNVFGKSKNVEAASAIIIYPLIEQIVSEKRAQYKEFCKLSTIDIAADDTAYTATCLAEPIELVRVLSNLIDNGIEAMPHGGHLTVRIVSDSTTQSIQINVIDTGVGIPDEVLQAIGEREVTYGKKYGSGIGLYNAIKVLRRWGGEIKIATKANEGTEVKVCLMPVAPPGWLATQLHLDGVDEMYVFDDDPSIFHTWKQRLRSSGVESIKIMQFQDPNMGISNLAQKKSLFLIDFEFSGFLSTGIDVARRLPPEVPKFFVTSQFDRPALQSAAIEMGIKIIPKNIVPHLTIILNDLKIDTLESNLD